MDYVSTYLNIYLVVVIAILTALSYFRGKRILFAIIASYYPAVAMYMAFPYKAQAIFMKANADQIFYSHVALFFAFFILAFFVANRIVHTDGTHQGVNGFVEALLLSVSVVLLSTALTFHVLPYRDIYGLGMRIEGFLKGDLGYFVSMVLPIAVVYWMTRRRRLHV